MRQSKYISVRNAEYVSGYRLRIHFNDGTEQVVDFEPFLRRDLNPLLAQYRALKKFKNFHLDQGDLMWGDYEMVFPIVDLYYGEI